MSHHRDLETRQAFIDPYSQLLPDNTTGYPKINSSSFTNLPPLLLCSSPSKWHHSMQSQHLAFAHATWPHLPCSQSLMLWPTPPTIHAKLHAVLEHTTSFSISKLLSSRQSQLDLSTRLTALSVPLGSPQLSPPLESLPAHSVLSAPRMYLYYNS